MSYYMHSTPGRLRLKNPLFKNRDAQDRVKKVLSGLTGIATVDISSTTGSLTIYYNASMVSEFDIVNTLQRAGFFDRSQAISNDEYIQKAASSAGKVIGKAALGVFVDKALEGTALSLLTILL